jgi:hypothetical protein
MRIPFYRVLLLDRRLRTVREFYNWPRVESAARERASRENIELADALEHIHAEITTPPEQHRPFRLGHGPALVACLTDLTQFAKSDLHFARKLPRLHAIKLDHLEPVTVDRAMRFVDHYLDRGSASDVRASFGRPLGRANAAPRLAR